MVKGLTAIQNPVVASFTSAEQLFVQVWTELFASFSIDSCQVRVSNARTILQELAKVTQWVLDGECRDGGNLDALRDETLKLLKDDPVFLPLLPTARNPLLQSLGKGTSRTSAVRTLQYQCRSALRAAEEHYRQGITDRLREAISAGDREKVRALAGIWATDLVSEGVHPSALYSLGRRFIRPQQNWSFTQRFDWLLASLTSNIAWDCYIPVSAPPVRPGDLGELNAVCISGEQCQAEISEIITEASGYALSDRTYIAVRGISAPSPADALDRALLQVEQRLDVIHMCRRGAWNIPARGIVVSQHPPFVKSLNVPASHFEPPSGNPTDDLIIDKAIQFLSSRPRHQERVRNALRFYRLGVTAESPAPRFLNLWIALETALRSEDVDRDHTESVLCSVLVRRHGYRLLRNLVEDIRRADLEPESLGIAGQSPQSQVASLLTMLQHEASSQALVTALESVPLLAQRAEDYASRFRTGVDAAKSLEQHQKRTYWHIRRLYRTRNRIVHSADVASPLSLLNGHLQGYCHHALLEMAWQLSRGKHDDLDYLLQDLVDGTKMQLELLRAESGAYDPLLLLNPPLSVAG